MKVIINSNALIDLDKLVKSDFYQINVKDKVVKIIATIAFGKNELLYQVIVNEKTYGNEVDGEVVIPREAIILLPKNESCLINENSIITNNQEIKLLENNYSFTKYDEKIINSTNAIYISNFNELIGCSYAIAKEESRPILNSICINGNDFATLDGYRMSVRSCNEIISEEEILLPGYITKLLIKMNKEKAAIISQDDECIKISFGWISIISKKHEGTKFPKYKDLWPTDSWKTHIRLNPEELISICKQIVRTNCNTNTMVINLSEKKSFIKMRISELEIKKVFKSEFEGEDLEIAVSPRYLMDALAGYKGTVDIYMRTNISPIIITDNQNKKEMVLPIRLTR